jgi:tight adherence protein C
MQTAMFFAIPILVAISAFLFVLSLIPSKSALTEALESLKTRDVVGRDSREFAVFDRMFKGERRALLTRKLMEAGWYTVTPAKIAMRIAAGMVFGLVLALLVWNVLHIGTLYVAGFAILAFAIGAYAPIFALNQAIEKRKVAIQKALPDFLDMVSSTVQAGLALNAAMNYAVDVTPGPLGEEIKEALSEVRLGRSRAEALKAAAERTNHQDLKTAVTAITQAERLGSNISIVLNELAEDARHHRVMLVEEMAAKLPVKMTFPMIAFMLPALFVVIFGSLLANYFSK